MENKIALISGAFGQDGSYMVDLLLNKGYQVIGLHYNSRNLLYSNLSHLQDCKEFKLIQCDFENEDQIASILIKYKPNEFYHFAAQSSVSFSWICPNETFQSNTISTLNCLEAIRKYSPKTKFFLASTSEVYKSDKTRKFNEDSEVSPGSPYAISKFAAEGLVKKYRDKYNLFACYARLFSHTSPRQSGKFVSKKIIDGIRKIYLQSVAIDKITSLQPVLLGDLTIRREFSHAKDIIDGCYKTLQLFEPQDFVLGSGQVHTLRQFIHDAAKELGLHEYCSGIDYSDKDFCCADITKAKKILNWFPKITFNILIKEMV